MTKTQSPQAFTKNKLQFVHIGKCGGSTVRAEIKDSKLLEEKFASVKIIHAKQPKYSTNDSYLIVIRNPIQRVISAYNWRKHLVVESGVAERERRGEWEVLNKYTSLNHIAELLYNPENEKLNSHVLTELYRIGHMKKNISFYTEDLLRKLRPSQIYGVIKQHSISEDCIELLGSSDIGHEKRMHSSKEDKRKYLSAMAQKNLKRLLYDDYKCILKLYTIGAISKKDFDLLSD
ncbi:hypothetical protein [Synechococcus sp. MU1655]|uniref:hypothetical protein n=1 Tax=Synechococcus sp. MU1655 TaxID=2508355 RepID=UPI002025CF6C|nr:hypothetical protein [Synechococcus sp. MU1655]